MKFNTADIQSINSFYDFDDQVTAPLHGYKDADDYYRRASSYSHLDKIRIPTLLLHAVDDPFMNSSVIPDQTERTSSVKLELSQNGGHVGFYQPSIKNNSYWLERRITDFLKSQLEEEKKGQRLKAKD
jgi:predicted alpha/beta-fold hydrolase